ncbi:hypothetical protein E3P78_03875 [Wallemia ichthyophaga]|nr:hypothetical protein E3P78_03875 [Wallemia ichthyophaga]
MDKSKRFSLMPTKTTSADITDAPDTHHRRVASADAEPNESFGSHLDVESRNAPTGELQPLLTLVHAHSRKVYFSGYLAQRTVQNADGKPLKTGDSRGELQGVFVKLIGNVLNVWMRKGMESAAAAGQAIPPNYINISDSHTELVGSILVAVPPPEYQRTVDHVFALNYAGLNRQEYVAQDKHTLHTVVTAIRLSAWEKKRLEELYTGHLLRILQRSNLPGNSGRQPFIEPHSPLVKGKMEGWVKVRFSGTAKWQRYWLVLTNYRPSERKKSFFGGSNSNTATSSQSHSHRHAFPSPPNYSAIASFYAQKNVKSSTRPIYTMTLATQAYAIFPERTELISHSGLMKIDGRLENGEENGYVDQLGQSVQREDGWCLLMPDVGEKRKSKARSSTGSSLTKTNSSATSSMSSSHTWSEMLNWLVGIHDSFHLYGRPKAYSFDPRDPRSLFFAYPIGPQRGRLFLDMDLARGADVHEKRGFKVRSNLLAILHDRMLPPSQQGNRGKAASDDSSDGVPSTRPVSLQPGGQVSPDKMKTRLARPPSIPSIGAGGNGVDGVNAFSEPLLAGHSGASEHSLKEHTRDSENDTLLPENRSYHSYRSYTSNKRNTHNNTLHTDTSPSLPRIEPLGPIGMGEGGQVYGDVGSAEAGNMHNTGSKSTASTAIPSFHGVFARDRVSESESENGGEIERDELEGDVGQFGQFAQVVDTGAGAHDREAGVRTPFSSISTGSLQTPASTGTNGTGSVEEQTARAAQELRRKLSLGGSDSDELDDGGGLLPPSHSHSVSHSHAPHSRQSINSAAFDQHVIPYPIHTNHSGYSNHQPYENHTNYSIPNTPYSEGLPSVQSVQSAYNDGSIASKYSQNTYNDYSDYDDYDSDDEGGGGKRRGEANTDVDFDLNVNPTSLNASANASTSDQYLNRTQPLEVEDNERTPHMPSRPPPVLSSPVPPSPPAPPAPKPASLQAGSPVSPVARSNTSHVSYSRPPSLRHSHSHSHAQGHTRTLSHTGSQLPHSPLGREGSVYGVQDNRAYPHPSSLSSSHSHSHSHSQFNPHPNPYAHSHSRSHTRQMSPPPQMSPPMQNMQNMQNTQSAPGMPNMMPSMQMPMGMGMQMPMGMGVPSNTQSAPGSMQGMQGMQGMPPMDPSAMGNQASIAMIAAQQAFQQSMWQYHQQQQGGAVAGAGVHRSPSQSMSMNMTMSPSQPMAMSPQSPYSQYSQMSPQSSYPHHLTPSPQNHNHNHHNQFGSPDMHSQSYQSFYTHSPQN